MTRVAHAEQYVGQVFGDMVITGISKFVYYGKPGDKKRRKAKVFVKCKCGAIFDTFIESLQSGKTVSCGCARKKYKNSAQAKAYREYKFSAKKRKYAFNLTHEEFSTIVEQDCHYCGSEPMRKTEFLGDSYIHNGIDRKDNTIGYEIDNVVPCCTICNHAKMDLPYDDFISWIRRLRTRDI